jgi:hypothetical protein
VKFLPVLFLIGAVGLSRLAAQSNAVEAGNISATTVETIVCLRHGEKPPAGLGQLSCQGLNRALALPKVLLEKFGTPQFIFAPNPTQKVDGTNTYYYVRPLTTIEPTAIRCGLPVNTQFGFLEIKGLETELQKPDYQNAVIVVAWEHFLLDDFAKNLMKDNGGDAKEVPDWPGKEFDQIFIFKIINTNGQKKISFTIDHEGLNGLSSDCP